MAAAYLSAPRATSKPLSRPHWCAGKIGFATVALAAEVGRRRKRGAPVRSHYKCTHCGLWHVGVVPSAATVAARSGVNSAARLIRREGG